MQVTFQQFIFSSVPQSKLLFSNADQIQSIITTNDIAYLSIQQQGIWVYNYLNQTLVAKLQAQQFQDVTIFCVSQNNSIIYSILDQSIQSFNFQLQIPNNNNNSQSIILQTNLKSSLTIRAPIQKILLDFSEKNLFIYGGTQIALYSSLTLSQISVFDLNQNIQQMRLSLDGNYLFLLSTYQGQQLIRIFQINENQAFNEVGQTIQYPTVSDFEISHNRMWIYGIDQVNCAILIASVQPVYSNAQGIAVISTWQSIWPYSTKSSIITIKFTKDDNYFMIGLKSQGILVFDASNKLNPQLYYQITFSELPKFFELNGYLQNYFVISDSQALLFYNQIQINLNQKTPNLFNQHLQELIPISQANRCLSVNSGANLIVSQSTLGFSLLQFYDLKQPYNVKANAQLNLQNVNYQDVVFDINTQSLYGPSTPTSNNLMDYFKLSYGDSLNSPQITLLQSFSAGNNNFQQQQEFSNIYRSKDGNLILQTYGGNGFLLYDSSKYPQLNLIKMNTLFNYTVHQADITKDNKWVICTQRQIGSYGIVSISDLKNINLQNLFKTSGVEGVVTSSLGNYVYLYDGSKGISILDTSFFPQIKVISNVKIHGWVSYVNLFKDENFILASTYSTNLVTLIDIKDKQNPFIVANIQRGQENGNSSCLSYDENYIYILNGNGIKYLPLSTNNQIHFQLNSYNKASKQFQEIDNSSFLQIGQLYSIRFTVLYPNQGNVITQVLYYSNFEKTALPSWISFDSSTNMVLINAQREGLGTFQYSPPISKQNILLLTVQKQVQQTDFIFDSTLNGIQTSQDQSNQIFQQLQQMGTIRKDNYLISSFYETQLLNLNLQINGFSTTQQQMINNLVYMRLQQTLEIVPISFQIQQSLRLNFQNPSQIINTYSNQATLTLSVEKSAGQFVQKQYKNVIFFFNDTLSSLSLEGSIQNLNKILFEKIIFYAYQELSQISLKIIVQDNINYQLNQTILLSDPNSQFIQQKIAVKLNNPLQQQINNYLPQGVIYLLSSLSIQFNQNSFSVSEPYYIKYALFVQQNKNQMNTINSQYNQFLDSSYLQTQQNLGFVPLADDDWIQFDSINLKLNGYAYISLYLQVRTYKLVAFDGYSYAEDTFQLKVQGLPVSLILIFVIILLIILTILIGIFSCRSYVYNIFYQKKVGSAYEEKVIINRFFVKKIAIIGDELIKAQKLLDSIITVMRNNKDQVFFLSQKHQNISESVQDDISIKKTIKEKNTFFRNQLCNNELPVQRESLDDILEQNDKKKQLLIKNFILNVQNKLEIEKANRRHIQVDDNKFVSSFQMKQGYTISNKIELWIIKKKILAYFTDTLFKNISIDKIWAFLQKHKVCYIYNDQTIAPHQYGLYLQDPTNVFYYCFLSCMSEFLLKMDDFSFLVYNLLIELIKLNPKKDKREWYDRYVKVTTLYPSITEISSAPFPEVEFNEKLIKSDLDQIFNEEIAEFKNQKLLEIKYQLLQYINLNLIKQIGSLIDFRLDSNSSTQKIPQSAQQSNSRPRIYSNFSPSSLSQNQNNSPVTSIKKLSFNIEENTIYNYQNQRTKSAFQRLQSQQQTNTITQNINDRQVERKKINLQRVELHSSFEENFTCDTNDDYKPIIVYETQFKKIKNKEQN
ncbi:transmembrane protein, putative (macronuclear) [Tetrahymena thermophila SB210]|uniref:Transmembrane protein, putative n=1 Tax=Tetrahymena thermophila (strain SB210) TaxID=312017 RepID=I7LUS0_TETTS|nr:transmembrane protein, putative [Tetrahymena thermophila SB210]EAR95780.2 transmembrane protein, putative [Tetrahymena thermophila SB210]|eukprot:XP_001016025.2 transmembrane protein, putative [Tetrahymena thermophila SB210]